MQTNPYVALLSRSPLSLSADSLYCERLIHMHTPLRLVGLDFGAYFGGYEGFEVRILGRWFDVLLYPYPVMFRHKRTHIQNKTPTPTRTHYRQAWKRVQGNRMSRWNEQWLDLRCLDTNRRANGPGVKEMMGYRLAYAAKKGCQLVEPDNVCAERTNDL